ncbi:MAG: hypothetical protein V8S20_02490 [Candidatus Gastranaerophilaceae bacterium]
MRRSMKRVNVKKENKPFKTLAIATIAGLSIIGIGQAQAATLDDIDLSQKQINTPTLDYLHDNTVFLPQKTFQRDADGNIVKDANDKPIIQEGTPILAPQSGYSLTELEAKEDGSKPDGNNVITKFEVKDVTRYYDKTTGKLVTNPISGTEYKVVQEKDLVPHYYNVNTVTPELNNSSVTWTEVTEEGNNTIKISSPDGTKYYKYTYNAPSDYDTTTNSNKTKDLGTITDPPGTYENPVTYKGGAVINNPAGSTITIENYVFQNNKTTATFESTTSYDKYVNLIGGAIYNEGEISKITSDFIGNSISVTTSSDSIRTKTSGGAIYNNGTIGNITGDFIGNSAEYSYGGAITNKGAIENITGNFIGNSNGGIDNSGTIGNITGNFIGNSNASYGGGAIYNGGTIGNITGNFIGNSSGTVISNNGTIGNITGDFFNNHNIITNFYSTSPDTAIGNITGDFFNNSFRIIDLISYNKSSITKIGNITGNFFNNKDSVIVNHFENNSSVVFGNITADFIKNNESAIYTFTQSNSNAHYGNITGNFINNKYGLDNDINSNSTLKIGNVTGNFIGNYRGIYNWITNSTCEYGDITGNFINNSGGAIYNSVSNSSNVKLGNITGDFIGNSSYGAIYNYSNVKIGDITGDFIGNSSNRGGAIYNDGSTIDSITGDFIGNSASSGGVIYNYKSTIGDITGDFIRNTASSGGAIYNDYKGKIGNITGDFIGNSGSEGGVIYNYDGGTIGDIKGDFIGNTSISAGAIRNYKSTIGDIIGDFIGNSSISTGGAIYNSGGTIGDITGNFIGNSSTTYNGGAIYNDYNGTIGDITGNFIGNTASSNGGAIYNYNSTIGEITGDFIGNTTSARYSSYGGAIYNHGNSTIGDITGDFIGNYAKSETEGAKGGAIYNNYNSTIGDITGDFIGNYTSSFANSDYYSSGGGAIYNYDSTIGNVTGNFIGNTASSRYSSYGGAIYNDYHGTIGDITGDFIGNYAKSETGEAKGGAIYSYSDLSLVADNRTNTFKDNYTESKGVKDDNAIYINNNATLNFKMKNNGKFYMADNIDGTVRKDSDGNITDTYSVNIKGDDINNTTFYMLNDIRNANVTFDNTTINAVNNQTHVYNFNTLTVNSDTNFVADVDLANAEMDRITANTYGTHQGNLNVVGMNLLSDSTKDVTEIYFAEDGLKDKVVNGMPTNGGYNLLSSAQTTLYTPIYKYNAIYDNRDDGGYFMFAKGDKILTPSGGGGITVTSTGNPSDAYNPAILSSSVASQAGANATMNQTFNYSFQNSDNFMSIPYLERVAIKTSNRYALSPTGDATDVGTFSQLFNAQNETSSTWVKPYASFENIPLKNGPKVSNITYGTLVGFDTPIKSIRHGWDRTWTGYIGYNGASQRFSGVDSTQNGGLVGGTLTLYKGNLFNATTVSTGAIVGDNRTMYGTDNYTMLMAGVGNKTGYNFEFKEGKIIIQPSMLLSYTFVNTFDYTNAAGVRIKNDPLHAIQIVPGVKFIVNTKNGWQPYIGVNMIWNLLDESKVSANDVRLPEMSIKPYVQYGVGVQKRFKDRYMAFGQAMIQNGGRNGISLTAGFRWAIGKDGKPLEKVQRVNNKVSSVTPRAEVKVANNSTVQPERKIIKQLTPEQRVRLGARLQDSTRTTSLGSLRQI